MLIISHAHDLEHGTYAWLSGPHRGPAVAQAPGADGDRYASFRRPVAVAVLGREGRRNDPGPYC